MSDEFLRLGDFHKFACVHHSDRVREAGNDRDVVADYDQRKSAITPKSL